MKKTTIIILTALVIVAALLLADHVIRTEANKSFADGYRAGKAAVERTPSGENLYPACGVVIEIDYDADTVTVEDAVGHRWKFYGAEDWCLGDMAALIMYEYGTPTVTDDEIIDVNYCGITAWFEEVAARVTEE